MLFLTLMKLRSIDYDTRTAAFAEATRNRDVEALLQVISDDDQYVRGGAIQALGDIADAIAVPLLIDCLDDADLNNQESAVAALGKMGDMRATQPLLAVLRDPQKHTQARCASARALVSLGDIAAVQDLLEALQDKDELSRYLSLEVLAVTADARSIPAVIACLRDPESNVRWEAVEALGALRDRRAVDPLLNLMSSGESGSEPIREVIVNALGRIGDPRAAPVIATLLNEPNRALRKAAAAALNVLGWEPAGDAQSASLYLAQERWDEVQRLGWEREGKALLDSLRNGDLALKLKVVNVLGRIDKSHAVDPLIMALSDEDIADAAAIELSKIGDSRAVKPLIEHSLRYSPERNHMNSRIAPRIEQTRADQWITPLKMLIKRSASAVDPSDLLELAGLADKEFHLSVENYTPGYGPGSDDLVVKLDFSEVRQLATQELARRGLGS